MVTLDRARDVVRNFDFGKGDYLGAEKQLSKFSDLYAKLSAVEANTLRGEFDAKIRLGWLRVSSSLFVKEFPCSDTRRQTKLARIFFTMYSFENLDFGYDGVLDLICISDYLKCSMEIDTIQKILNEFSKLTSNQVARGNLVSKLS